VLLREPAIAREGWLDVAEIRRFYDSMMSREAAGDITYSDDVWQMWMLSAVELWMQEVADRRPQ